jgi:Protein of unknown function (DUF4054)
MAAYDLPTVDDFRAKFPELAYLSDDQIQGCIDEAARAVDDTWTEGDYDNAILYLAAHYATAAADAVESGGAPSSQGPIVAEHIGPISVSYGSTGSQGSTSSSTFNSSLNSTYYGQRYLDLLVKNIPAVLVI